MRLFALALTYSCLAMFGPALHSQDQTPSQSDVPNQSKPPVVQATDPEPQKVGGGVSAPKVIKAPDPEYSKEARKAKYEATSVLWVIVQADGTPGEIRVKTPAGKGLDEKAIEAVRKWRFKPAMKDGKPIAVQINIEINFRLH